MWRSIAARKPERARAHNVRLAYILIGLHGAFIPSFLIIFYEKTVNVPINPFTADPVTALHFAILV